MKNIVEKYNYKPGSNGTFAGYPLPDKDTGKEVTACTECLAVRNAFAIRTEYDKYFMEFYNNKAQNFETDLLALQFPDSSVSSSKVHKKHMLPTMTPHPSYPKKM